MVHELHQLDLTQDTLAVLRVLEDGAALLDGHAGVGGAVERRGPRRCSTGGRRWPSVGISANSILNKAQKIQL